MKDFLSRKLREHSEAIDSLVAGKERILRVVATYSSAVI